MLHTRSASGRATCIDCGADFVGGVTGVVVRAVVLLLDSGPFDLERLRREVLGFDFDVAQASSPSSSDSSLLTRFLFFAMVSSYRCIQENSLTVWERKTFAWKITNKEMPVLWPLLSHSSTPRESALYPSSTASTKSLMVSICTISVKRLTLRLLYLLGSIEQRYY